MKSLRSCLLLLALSLAVSPLSAQDTEASRPNILVVLCDDLGYGDLACNGHEIIDTPHLDKLAGDGIRFTDFYSAAPVCSPSRVGLLTGRTPNRAGVYDWIPEYTENRKARTIAHMRGEEATISQTLKDAGYVTCMSGKWHCNSKFNEPDQPQPGDFGFDHWFGTQNNASPSHENPVNFVRNGEEVGPIEGYSCQIVADEVIDWLQVHSKKRYNKPFFVYMAFHEPHEPVASPKALVDKYLPEAENEDEAQYFANVENLDAATGKVLATLDELGYRDNTLVIFTSDNGPETLNRYRNATRSYGTPGELRGMKLHTHEAGYHVAGIMRWPQQIKAGQVIDTPVCSLDFFPTFCDLAGIEPPAGLELDGANFLPALEGKAIDREKPLAWCYYNAINEAKVALRDGDWKILGTLKDFGKKDHITAEMEEMVKTTPFESYEIYNLKDDRSEEHDLMGTDKAPIESLTGKLQAFYDDLVEDQPYWKVD